MQAKSILSKLQKTDLTTWTFTFWVIHRVSRTPPFDYSAKRLKVSTKLESRVRGRIIRKISEANEVKPYEEEQRELEDDEKVVYSSDCEGNDVGLIVDQIDTALNAAVIKSKEELEGAHGYAVELTDPQSQDQLIAFRKISKAWHLAEPGLFDTAYWRNEMLVELKQDDLFRIDGKFDFMFYGEQVFILDRRHFERGLNLRAGMQKKAAAVFTVFEEKALFVDVDWIKTRCQDNLRFLRRLSTVENRGYYKQPEFLIKLEKIAQQERWDVGFKNGKIEANDTNLLSVLTVLADQRLKSLLTDTTYDADATRRFEMPS